MAFEALFAIKGDGWCLMVADRHVQAHQLIGIKQDEDKISVIDSKLFGATGPSADRVTFTEYIEKNTELYKLRNGVTLSTKAAATFTRNEMATALRRGPYQCDLLIAGYDEDAQDATLYFIDAYCGMCAVNKAAHGYSGNFTMGILDKHWTKGLTVEEGKKIVAKCIAEIKLRYSLARMDEFMIKLVDKTGVTQIPQVEIAKLV